MTTTDESSGHENAAHYRIYYSPALFVRHCNSLHFHSVQFYLTVIGFSCIFSQPPLITLTQKPYTNSMLASQTFIPACIQFDVYYQCLLG